MSCSWSIWRISLRRARRRCSVALNSVIVGVAPGGRGTSDVLSPDIYAASRPTTGEYARGAPEAAPATACGFPQFAWREPVRLRVITRCSAAHLVDIVPCTRSRQYGQNVSGQSSGVQSKATIQLAWMQLPPGLGSYPGFSRNGDNMLPMYFPRKYPEKTLESKAAPLL